jgi:hypothetical protein
VRWLDAALAVPFFLSAPPTAFVQKRKADAKRKRRQATALQNGSLSLECGGLTPLWLCLSFSPLLQPLSCKNAKLTPNESGVKPPHSKTARISCSEDLRGTKTGSNQLFAASRFRPPTKMKLERLTFGPQVPVLDATGG